MCDTNNSRPTNSIDLHEMIRFDAVSMELLTSSDRIVSIYSHCSLSVHVQSINGHDIEELIMHEVREDMEYPPPELSPTEKLQMALEMAEALSELHGYAGGPIVHNDVQYAQVRNISDTLARF